MPRQLRLRWLARQFARPSGVVGRFFIAPWMDRISSRMRRMALERLELDPGDALLEVGFGGGALLREAMAVTSGRVVGIDLSAAAVARGRRLLPARAELFPASVEAIPLAKASVDAAVSLNSLYFWADPEAGIREIARVLKPGGRLVLGFEPPEELGKWPGSRFGFRALEEQEVRAILRAAGFAQIEAVEGKGRRPDRFLILSADLPHANE